MAPVRSGRRVVWAGLGLHGAAAAGALALPPVACLLALAGIAVSAAAFRHEAARPVLLQCHDGQVSGWPEPAARGPAQPVRVIPFLARHFLVLQFGGPGARRYRVLGRGDLPQDQHRALLTSARWPARHADHRAG